jgi:Flp pilus assembly protein TadD
LNVWKSGRISIKTGGVSGIPVRSPEGDRATLKAVQEAAQARDMDRAAALAEQALKSGLEHPMLFNLVALKLEAEERYEDAVATLTRAAEVAPEDLGVRHALGLNLHRLERYAEALAAFDAVLAAQDGFAPGHVARGEALAALGRISEAEAAYRRALDLQPGNLVALSGMAALLSRRGQHAEARAMAEPVLAQQPGYPDAVMVLAAADLGEGKAADAETRLRGLAADPRATTIQRALAQGQLGDVLDAEDRVPEAFEAYAACNMSLWRAYQASYGQGPGALAFAREMLERLDAIPAEDWAATGEPPPDGVRGHVFLMGFPRSGTTLLEQVLASHPDVEALEERETLVDGLRAFMASPDDLDRLAMAGEAELSPLRDAYWARVRAEGADPAGKVFVDKHPLNAFKLPLIAKLFPQAVILFARRDPRDVVLSCYRRRFAMSGPAYQLLTLPGAAAYYDAAMRLADAFAPVFGERFHVVRHESLIEDFDAEAAAVCKAIGLPFTAAMRGFAERTRDRGIATPSGAQLARGLTAEGVGQWRRYRDQLAPVLPALSTWAARFGYAAE